MAVMLHLACWAYTGTWTPVNAHSEHTMQSVYVWSHICVTSRSHFFVASLNWYSSRWPSPSTHRDRSRLDVHHPQATWAQVPATESHCSSESSGAVRTGWMWRLWICAECHGCNILCTSKWLRVSSCNMSYSSEMNGNLSLSLSVRAWLCVCVCVREREREGETTNLVK
jgi:hypothetical protein